MECHLLSHCQARPDFPEQIWADCEQVLDMSTWAGVSGTSQSQERVPSEGQDTCSRDSATAVEVQVSSWQWDSEIMEKKTRWGRSHLEVQISRNSSHFSQKGKFPGAKLQFWQFLEQELTRESQDPDSGRNQRSKQLFPGRDSGPTKETGWRWFPKWS